MLASRLMEEYLELLGACRRDIAVYRGAFTELLESCTVDDEPYEQEEEDRVRLLRRLAPVAEPGHCLVCTQRSPDCGRRLREFCSVWCRGRAQTLCNKGLLPSGPALLLSCPASSAWSSPTTRRL